MTSSSSNFSDFPENQLENQINVRAV